jgi:hypothetical protein
MAGIYDEQLPASAPRPVTATVGTNLISPPLSFYDRLAHFPEEVYDLSPHSHLVKFMAVVLGDAGAAGLRKRTLLARLQSSVSGTHWFDLDRFWGSLFGLTRRVSEALPIDPYSSATTASGWHDIEAKDGEYRSRILQFARAIGYGATATGMELIAEAILQIDVDIEEEWESADDPVTTYDDLEALGTYDDLEAVGTYDDLEAVGGGTSTINRHSFIVRPRRPITEEERWDLVRILHVIKPAASTLKVIAASSTGFEEVPIGRIDDDSHLWEIKSITTIRADGSSVYSDTTGLEGSELVDIEQPRPPWSVTQSENWSYTPDVSVVTSYGEITETEVESPNWERIEFSTERRDYLPDHALRPVPEVMAARLVSDGVMVSHPYDGPRRLPDHARPPAGFTGASLAGMTRLYLDSIPLDGVGEVNLDDLAINWRRNRSERFWSSTARSASDPRWETLEVRLRVPRRINWITFEVAQFPSVIEVQHRDVKSSSWVTISSTRLSSSSPSTFISRHDQRQLHPQHGWAGHWHRIEQAIPPIITQVIRIRIQRSMIGQAPVGFDGEAVDYSLAVRDLDFGYAVRSLDDIPNQLLSGTPEVGASSDAFGSRVTYNFVEYKGSNLLEGGSWISDPQPIPGSVVNLYLDLRDRYGNGQIVDRLELDPITPGVPFNLYYSDDTTSQQTFSGKDESVAFSVQGFVDPQRGTGFRFDDGAPSGIEINNTAIHFDPQRDWWVGLHVQPSVDSTTAQDCPVWSFGDNELYLHEGVEFRGLNGEVITCPITWLINSRLFIHVRYTAQTQTLTIRAVVEGGDDIEVSGVVNSTSFVIYPELVYIGGRADQGSSCFLLRSFVLKLVDQEDSDAWLASYNDYSLKPLYPSMLDLTYNSILRFHPSYITDDIGGLVGGPPNFYESLRWTPIPGDYTLQKGVVGFSQIKPRFLKMEFSGLAVRPYETGLPVSRPIRLFPPLALEAISPEADVHAAWPGLQTAMGLETPLRTDIIPSSVTPETSPTSGIYPTDLGAIGTFRSMAWAYGFMPWQISSQRPRFTREGVHDYIHQVVAHNVKLAWHVGLKALRCYSSNPTSRMSPEAFIERFLSARNFESSDWVLADGITTGIGTSVTVTSRTFQTLHNIEGAHWATTQTEPIQVLPDDNFRDPALGSDDWTNENHWHIHGDASVAYLPHDHSVLVIRDINIDIPQIESFGIMVDPIHPVQSFYRSGLSGSSTDGGIESPLVVVSPEGYLHAAVRVVGIMTTESPIWLQIVASDGTVVAEESRMARPGEVIEWTTSLRLGGADGMAVPIWDPQRTIIDSPLHPTGLGYDPLVDESGGLAGDPARIFKVRVVQKEASGDSWVIQRCSLFDDSILWEFSNDGGVTWVKAPSVTRNNPTGVVNFPSGVASLKWRVTGYRRNLHVTSLQIRPIYDQVTTARLSVPWRGGNVSAYDTFPPIQEDPEFTGWTDPVPRWWYTSGLRHEQDPFLYDQPTTNEFSLFYTVSVTEDDDAAETYSVSNRRFNRVITETDDADATYGRAIVDMDRAFTEDDDGDPTYEGRVL